MGNRYPVLSFFSGAGFMDLGFADNFDVCWSNEVNLEYSRAYIYNQHNVAFWHHNTNSITEVPSSRIVDEAFGGNVPEIFGVVGGPPCPDFSIGGKNKGGAGDKGQLSGVYVERIMALNPSFFVFENVAGLIRTRKHRIYLRRLLEHLTQKYFISLRVLNALEFGIPQDRERLFIIGFQKTLFNGFSLFQWGDKRNGILMGLLKGKIRTGFHLFDYSFWPIPPYFRAKEFYDWPTTDKFGTSCLEKPPIPDCLMVNKYIGDDLADLPNGSDGFRPKSNKFKTVLEGDVSRKSFKRLHRWRYSPTVAYGNNEVHLHPTKPRRLTVREGMRLQTVPDTYVFPCDLSLTDKFKMISNGVPVALAQVISNIVKDVLYATISG